MDICVVATLAVEKMQHSLDLCYRSRVCTGTAVFEGTRRILPEVPILWFFSMVLRLFFVALYGILKCATSRVLQKIRYNRCSSTYLIVVFKKVLFSG